MFQLTGQVALVTGASGGIGASIAKILHRQGAIVAISGTKEDTLRALAEELKQERVHIFPCNLSNKEEVSTLFERVEKALGRVDILVNNAGITRDTLAVRMKDEDWDDVLAVNLTAAFRLCRAAVKSMMRQRYGRIINIASVVGVSGNAGQCNYTASKAGLIGLSKSLALESVSRGITVNCIAPGFTESNMTAKLPDAVKDKITASIPMGRVGTPEEIAAGVLFLASPEASYITGQTLHINGGMVMA